MEDSTVDLAGCLSLLCLCQIGVAVEEACLLEGLKVLGVEGDWWVLLLGEGMGQWEGPADVGKEELTAPGRTLLVYCT